MSWNNNNGRQIMIMVSSRMYKLLLLIVTLSAAPAAAADITLLVFPLDNRTGVKTLAWVGEGVAAAISEQCQVPGVDTIGWDERSRFVEASDLPPNATLSRASMIRVAQRAAVERMIYGSYSGTEDSLRLSIHMLDIRSMRLSSEITANGPASALPQLENELAWNILSVGGLNKASTRESFRARTRLVPNRPYSYFINCLAIADDSERFNLLQKAIELHRDFPQASFLLGAYHFQNGDCPKAVQHLKSALNETQNFLEAQFMIGTCSLSQENPGEAIPAFRAVAERVRSPEVLNNLGVAYLRAGDSALAVESLIEARKLARMNVTIGVNLAILHHLAGDETAALTVLDELVRANPDQGMLQYLYGLVLDRQGARESAAAARERAAKLGINAERMGQQDPRTWTRAFPVWTRRSILVGLLSAK